MRYTRNGEFAADEQGQLVTAAGDPVLGRNNQPVTLGADGKVDPRTLNVVPLNNPEKVGNNLVTGTPGASPARPPAPSAPARSRPPAPIPPSPWWT